MIIIDTKAYLLRMLVNIFILYFLILYITKDEAKPRKYVKILVLIPITFFVELFTDFSDLVPMLSSYFFLKEKGKKEIILLNKLILCLIVSYSISIISSLMMVPRFFEGVNDYTYVIVQIIFECVLLTLFVLLYKKMAIQEIIGRYSSVTTFMCMVYLWGISFFISYTAHQYKVFDQFILGVSVFLIVQIIFICILGVRTTKKQKEKYEQQLKEQELIHLKKYTDQLEQSQEKLNKFKHDYKNLLLSLKEISCLKKDTDFLKQVQALDEYSNHYLAKDISSNYQQLKNIKNSYLKSLFISKIYQANEYQLDIQLECNQTIELIPIPIFDCVRILGIAFDNAIEAAKESEDQKISLMVYQDSSQLEFFLENSCKKTNIPIRKLMEKGISTKIDHNGLGLNTIQEINEKTKNMFIQYNMKDCMFTTSIILMW
ncbi:putative piscicolin 126 histidine kinase [Carnobacterium maltaromaticum]|uniref:sensor histidine kinase n=1 Tax=Carnobacterium maltaromaticum TaxID=2751 RepID=UPI0019F6375C|nr:GHKL domain-containing protein [Carnobacterium maltaromaticum]CAD5897714.1 putative piscicolin 126 histidine kinase [Carnobacterium maltaromaticum]